MQTTFELKNFFKYVKGNKYSVHPSLLNLIMEKNEIPMAMDSITIDWNAENVAEIEKQLTEAIHKIMCWNPIWHDIEPHFKVSVEHDHIAAWTTGEVVGLGLNALWQPAH